MHLAGLFRSFSENVAHLRSFFDASARCWFVVLFTLDLRDSAASSWARGAKAVGFDDAARTVREALEPLRNTSGGGIGFALAARSHEGPSGAGDAAALGLFVHLANHQNKGASTLLARAVAAHHGLPVRPSDVILQTPRPAGGRASGRDCSSLA